MMSLLLPVQLIGMTSKMKVRPDINKLESNILPYSHCFAPTLYHTIFALNNDTLLLHTYAV